MIVNIRNYILEILHCPGQTVHQNCRLVILPGHRRLGMKVSLGQKLQPLYHHGDRLNNPPAKLDSVPDPVYGKRNDEEDRERQRQKEHSQELIPHRRHADTPSVDTRNRRESHHLCLSVIGIGSRPRLSRYHTLTDLTVFFEPGIGIAQRNAVLHTYQGRIHIRNGNSVGVKHESRAALSYFDGTHNIVQKFSVRYVNYRADGRGLRNPGLPQRR